MTWYGVKHKHTLKLIPQLDRHNTNLFETVDEAEEHKESLVDQEKFERFELEIVEVEKP